MLTYIQILCALTCFSFAAGALSAWVVVFVCRRLWGARGTGSPSRRGH